MPRKYNKRLIDIMQKETFIKPVNGIDVIFKPVPDDKREHVLDKRILETAIYKEQHVVSQNQSVEGFLLSKERYRPDKKSICLTKEKIKCREQLIYIRDHYINLHICSPEKTVRDMPVVIYFHGGGFISGDYMGAKYQMQLLCEKSQAIIVFPEYRLAPESPYPAAIEDALGTVEWCIKNAAEMDGNERNIILAGDSAGAVLCNCCIISLKYKDNISSAIELYPVCDMEVTGVDIEKEFPALDEQKRYIYSRIDKLRNLDGLKKLYLNNKVSGNDPTVSINYYDDFSVFPKMIIISSEYDYSRISSDTFVGKLYDAGADVTSIRYLGCDHGFMDMLGYKPQTEDVIVTMAQYIREDKR